MKAPESVLALRRRSGWEACDAGILLWQKNWPALLLFFGVPAGIATASACLLPDESLNLAGLALWWLMPFFDRFALHVVSVRFFDGGASCAALFRGLGLHLFKGLPGDLLWRRFSPYRSARMPLIVLEGLKGKELKRRRASLRLGFGFPLTAICMALNGVLAAGELVFAWGFFDMIQPGYLGDFWNFFTGISRLLLAVAWANELFVETLFVCMGFGIYINARVETEGWDIELLFRKFVEKAKKGFIAALFVLASLLVPLSEARAETEIEEYRYEEATAAESEALEKVLQNEDFGREVPSKRIEFKNQPRRRYRQPLEMPPWLGETLGLALRSALIALAVFVLAFSARILWKRRPFKAKAKNKAKASRQAAEEVDPRALLDEAAACYDAGREREAWAACFKAFAAAFRLNWKIAIPAEATEYETLRLARRFAGTSRYISDFETFVRRWVHFAYGGIAPETGGFSEARDACAELLSEMPAASGGRK